MDTPAVKTGILPGLMGKTSKAMAVVGLLVAAALSGCPAPPAAPPLAPAASGAPGTAAVTSSEPTGGVDLKGGPTGEPPADPICPTGTVWDGTQCEQPALAERPAPKPPEPEPEPEPAAVAKVPPSLQIQNGVLQLPGPVVFHTAKDTLKPESDAVLGLVKAYLIAKPEISMLRIEGHSDSAGLTAANQMLSEKRALSVARWLTAHGIACKRLLPVGFGETRPIAANTTADGRALNRRMAFVNAALKGKPVGALPVDGGGKVAGDPCAPTP